MTTFTIRRAMRSAAAVLAVTLALPITPATSGVEQAQLVRVLPTSDWAKPSTDPSGLGYSSGRRALVVVDSEVDEGPHFDGANIWFWRAGDRVLKAFSTTSYSTEPTDVAMGGAGGAIYVADDSEDRVFIVRKGPDTRWGTNDDTVKPIITRHFGSRDPAGVTFAAKSLWVTDGDNLTSDHRVYRLRPGPNGVIDGVAPQGDDLVTSFDTLPMGISKPSDLVFRGGSRHLFIVSAQEEIIVETTLAGVLVATYDMSHTSLITAAGVALAPGSQNAAETHLYVADRGLDNEDQPSENDGRVFEFAI